MKTTNRILSVVAFLTCVGTLACNDASFSGYSFNDLCVASGGTIDESTENCKCDVICDAGVVCINKKCANKIDVAKSCEPNETKCDDKEESVIQCDENGNWGDIIETCNNGCVNGKCAKSCEPNETQCDGDGIKTCDENGEWGESDKSCKFGCFDDTQCKECEDNTKICEGHSYKLCVSGKLSPAIECSSGVECLADGSGCKECQDGDTQCDDKGFKTCKDGKWSEPTACTCTADGKQCATCSENDIKCEESKEFRCINGQFVEIRTCDFGCNDTACAECNNDSKRCDSTTSYQVCKEGKWSDPEKCEGDTSNCVEGACSKESCKVGATICEDKVFKVCENEQWGEKDTCQNGCAADKISCAECTENTCENNQIIPCVDGKLGSPIQCGTTENPYSCSGNSCGVCINGNNRCLDGKSGKCENGQWIETACANNASCQDSTTCGVCVNGNNRCQNGKSGKCENGQWIETTCANGASCQDSSTCGVCVNDSTKCENGKIYSCQNGSWSESTTCSSGKCNTNETACAENTAECTNNETKCTNNGTSGVLKTCQNGKWDSGASCPSKFSCNGNQCGNCTNGAKKCEGNIFYECKNGNWGSGTKCNGRCDDNTGCVGESCTTQYQLCKIGSPEDGRDIYGKYCNNSIWENVDADFWGACVVNQSGSEIININSESCKGYFIGHDDYEGVRTYYKDCRFNFSQNSYCSLEVCQ